LQAAWARPTQNAIENSKHKIKPSEGQTHTPKYYLKLINCYKIRFRPSSRGGELNFQNLFTNMNCSKNRE